MTAREEKTNKKRQKCNGSSASNVSDAVFQLNSASQRSRFGLCLCFHFFCQNQHPLSLMFPVSLRGILLLIWMV